MGKRTKECPCKCLTCKGEGTTKFESISMKTGETIVTKNPCSDCKGEGWVSDQKAEELVKKKFKKMREQAQLQREIELYWCQCGNPSEDTVFYNDGQHPHCEKHCWCCKDCGKLIQVG